MSAPRDDATRERRPKLRILFEDRWLVVIDKPAGLASVPSSGVSGKTCVSELRASHPSAEPVHRLDREVSGAMLFALDHATRVAFEARFRQRLMEKTYLAVVSGAPRPPHGTIDRPIADLGKRAQLVRGGAPAVTHYKVRETFARGASLVEIEIETGRYNQIRLHFAAIGHPLIGERKYARGRESPIRFRRVALHAWKLAFAHPHTGAPVAVEAPPPADFRRLLDDQRRSPR